ncbi:putative secreted subtilisin-like serine protease [Streptomyces zinciresistens K42]|uniref:Putative secreted subtilisin-like serine protease n=1 Tax=Streptomyces zinciresistens K42 TaxID=700597 RepID=G2GFM7_9ACTN|nr:putative secreted subtilisin-like serine protease [Streptomyces zinciresistens K42]
MALTIGAGAALPAQAAQPEGTVLGAGTAEAVPGSYIVTLKQAAGFSASATQGKQLIAGYGGKITRTYTTALNGYAAQLSSTEAKRLAADPAVASVEQDRKVHSTATQTNAPWGLDRSDQTNLPLNGTFTYPDSAGSATTIFVLDTGVRITHQDLAGRASNGYDFVDNDAVAQDGNGHGTHVATTAAGTTYGVAKKAKVVAVRVLDNNGSGTTAGVIAGVDWITGEPHLLLRRQRLARRRGQHHPGRRGEPVDRGRGDVLDRGGQFQRPRVQLLARPGERRAHGRRHDPDRRTGELLQLRLRGGPLRARLRHHGRLGHLGHCHLHRQRHVLRGAARRRRGRRLPHQPPRRLPGHRRQRPRERRDQQRPHRCRHRLPEQAAQARPVSTVTAQQSAEWPGTGGGVLTRTRPTSSESRATRAGRSAASDDRSGAAGSRRPGPRSPGRRAADSGRCGRRH